MTRTSNFAAAIFHPLDANALVSRVIRTFRTNSIFSRERSVAVIDTENDMSGERNIAQSAVAVNMIMTSKARGFRVVNGKLTRRLSIGHRQLIVVGVRCHPTLAVTARLPH